MSQTQNLQNAVKQRIDTSGGPKACHPWTGIRKKNGYGRLKIKIGFKKYRKAYAHRLVMELHLGRKLRPEEFVCHKCDNPPCCNRRHLKVATASWNNKDAWRKGRMHCPRPAYAKFDDQTATLVKKLWQKGMSSAMLQEKFGVKRGVIAKLVSGVTYRNISPKGPARRTRRCKVDLHMADACRRLRAKRLGYADIGRRLHLSRNIVRTICTSDRQAWWFPYSGIRLVRLCEKYGWDVIAERLKLCPETMKWLKKY